VLTSTFGAGGLRGKSTFIRAIQLTRGGAGTSATLVQRNGRWVLRVVANGKPVAALQTVRVAKGITLQATPAKNGRPRGVLISLPYLRIRVAQRAPYKPHQARPLRRSGCRVSPLSVLWEASACGCAPTIPDGGCACMHTPAQMGHLDSHNHVGPHLAAAHTLLHRLQSMPHRRLPYRRTASGWTCTSPS
jgi:hypothetical protein